MPAVAQVADDVLDAVDRHRVDAGERLVEQDDLRVGDQRSGRSPAAAARRRRATCALLVRSFVMPNCSSSSSQRRLRVLAVHAEHFHHAQQILLHRELAEDARFLGQVAHAAFLGAAIHGPVGDVLAGEHDRAGVGLDHAAGHAEGGRLAGAVGAQQADDLARIDFEIDAVDDAAAAVRSSPGREL